jgi:hypothetical protein
MTAVEGVPEVTVSVPTDAPSNVKVTVPVGGVRPAVGGEMLAETCNWLPASGVVVAGVSVIVGTTLATVMVTAWEVEL